MIAVALRVVIAASIGAAIVAMLRWMARRSRVGAAIVALGLLARALVGLALFWISYAKLPVATSLNTGDGFWVLASDAPAYYRAALAAPAWGLGAVYGPAAGYVRLLALWMHVVGESPAAGLYLNLLMFVATAMIVLAVAPTRNDWRDDAPVLLCLAALSFNPTLVGHSTQPLKDSFMALALVCGCAAAYVVFKELHSGVRARLRSPRFWIAITGVLMSVYLVTGIRPYFAFVEWGCYFLAALVSWIVAAGQRVRTFAIHAVTLIALWAVMAYGGASYYREIMQRTIDAGVNPLILYLNSASLLREAQLGFVRTASGTNAAAPPPSDPGLSERAGGPNLQPVGGWSLPRGMILMFVPVVIAKSMSWLRFEGGRGLLALADLDTIFVDASIVMLLVLCVAGRAELRRNLPFFCFAVLMGVVSAGLIAFVVTNLGALLRLRLLFAVPMWVSAVALMPALSRHSDSSNVMSSLQMGEVNTDAR